MVRSWELEPRGETGAVIRGILDIVNAFWLVHGSVFELRVLVGPGKTWLWKEVELTCDGDNFRAVTETRPEVRHVS